MQPPKTASAWDPESTAGFWINRASRALLRSCDARLRPFGFAMSHLPVLRALRGGQSLSQKDLAQLARVEQPTMAEMLVRMERDGVVERARNPDDGRGTLISLTRRSRARIPTALAALVEGERAAMAGFSDADAKALRQLLHRVVQNLEAAELLPEPIAATTAADAPPKPVTRRRATTPKVSPAKKKAPR